MEYCITATQAYRYLLCTGLPTGSGKVKEQQSRGAERSKIDDASEAKDNEEGAVIRYLRGKPQNVTPELQFLVLI
jgi:hypothetical protein